MLRAVGFKNTYWNIAYLYETGVTLFVVQEYRANVHPNSAP